MTGEEGSRRGSAGLAGVPAREGRGAHGDISRIVEKTLFTSI